jgi:K+/H+ antiporter YhaU regulatory subunit KhtT
MSEPFGLHLMIEQTVTVGNIIEIAVIATGGISVFVGLRSTVSNIKEDVQGMQNEIKKLADIITRMAVTDLRLTNVEQDIREMRHGKGFVQESINGEYDYHGKTRK